MKAKAQAAVLASFAADSLSLGAHWIYNMNRIDAEIGRVDHLMKPPAKTYHPTKDRGEFTHYGDQMLVLLESVSACNGFDLIHFSRSWRNFFTTYDGYCDHATKDTLENFKAGKNPSVSGSSSSDLGGASRIAPLVSCYHNDFEKFITAAREQTAMTHNHPRVIESAEFLSRVVWKVLRGSAPISAIKEVSEVNFKESSLTEWVIEGMDSAQLETRSVISSFGQMCEINSAFPSVIHLTAKYEKDLKEALVENVMAGGDSAARGMVVGMILGAYLGVETIPADWLSGLKQYRWIINLIETIPI